jgi:hypothetical protein
MDLHNVTGVPSTPIPPVLTIPPVVESSPVPPTPPPPVVSSTPPSSIREPRRSHKGLIISIVVFVFLAAGGVFGYSAMSSAAVSSSLKKFDAKTKVNYKLDVSLNSDDTKLSHSFASVYIEADKTNPNSIPGKVVVDISSPYYSGGGEMRFIQDIIYIKADSLDAAFSEGAGFPASLWYSLALDTTKEIQKEYSQRIDFGVIPNPVKLSSSAWYEKLHDNKVLVGPDFTGFDTVGDSRVRTYEFTIDKKALAALIVREYGVQLAAEESNMDQTTLIAGVEKVLESVEITPIHASVSLFGTEIREVTFSVLASGELAPVSQGIKGVNFKLSHDPEITHVTISVPEGVIALDQIIKQQQLERKDLTRQVSIKSALSQTRVAAEVYFNKKKSYVGMCKSTDLAPLLAQIKSLGSTSTCRESAKANLLAATLLPASTTPQKYYCVDSAGHSLELAKLSAGYVCKGSIVSSMSLSPNPPSAVQTLSGAIKTYRDPRGKFEFQYPSDAKISEIPGNITTTVSIDRELKPSIYFFKQARADDYVPLTIHSTKKITIAGQQATQRIYGTGNEFTVSIEIKRYMFTDGLERADSFMANFDTLAAANAAAKEIEDIAKTLKYL